MSNNLNNDINGSTVNFNAIKLQILNDIKDLSTEKVFNYIISNVDENKNKSERDAFALHFATCIDNVEIVKKLILMGANLNAQIENNGKTPLHTAIDFDSKNAFKTLVDMGADFNFGILINNEVKATPLDGALYLGEIDLVKTCLSHISDINIKDENNLTFLHKTVMCDKETEKDNVEVVKFLVSKGIDINAETNMNETALEIAERLGNKMIVDYLKNIYKERLNKVIDEIVSFSIDDKLRI